MLILMLLILNLSEVSDGKQKGKTPSFNVFFFAKK